MSRQLLEQSKCELVKGDRLQASEKLWGASAHAVKAIAIERGWEHERHASIIGAARLLRTEYNNPALGHISLANYHHQNYYKNVVTNDEIQDDLQDIESFLDELDKVSKLPQNPIEARIDPKAANPRLPLEHISSVMGIRSREVHEDDVLQEGGLYRDGKLHHPVPHVPRRDDNGKQDNGDGPSIA